MRANSRGRAHFSQQRLHTCGFCEFLWYEIIRKTERNEMRHCGGRSPVPFVVHLWGANQKLFFYRITPPSEVVVTTTSRGVLNTPHPSKISFCPSIINQNTKPHTSPASSPSLGSNRIELPVEPLVYCNEIESLSLSKDAALPTKDGQSLFGRPRNHVFIRQDQPLQDRRGSSEQGQ